MIERYQDFDSFFFYGDADLGEEVAGDLAQILLQPKRSMLYSRSRNAAGISEYENTPNAVTTRVLVPFDVVSAVSKRNDVVGNGQDGTKERRIATSQNQVQIQQRNYQLDITVFYIPFFDLREKKQVGFQVGVNNRG